MKFLHTRAKHAKALYILGDFFDAWIGDDDDDVIATRIRNELKDFALSTPTFFIHGNRDFLLGQRFADETGVVLLPECTVAMIEGQSVLLMHGDTLCTSDNEYMQFRAMVRSPQWQQQVLSLALPQRRQMAAELRSKSQSLSAMKAADITDVTQTEVEAIMLQHQVDTLIHGHTHRPGKHTFKLRNSQAERWVLGDWHDTGWYIKSQDGQLELVEFAL